MLKVVSDGGANLRQLVDVGDAAGAVATTVVVLLVVVVPSPSLPPTPVAAAVVGRGSAVVRRRAHSTRGRGKTRDVKRKTLAEPHPAFFLRVREVWVVLREAGPPSSGGGCLLAVRVIVVMAITVSISRQHPAKPRVV